MMSTSQLTRGEVEAPEQIRPVAPASAPPSLDSVFKNLTAKSSAKAFPQVLDLRSDVVTTPTDEMWEVMLKAGFGGTPLDDDVTVRELEQLAAEVVGKQAAVFVPTCTAANLLAMMTLGVRGSQVVLEKYSHIAMSEEWGLAYICGLMPLLVEGRNGVMNSVQLREAMAHDVLPRKPRTSLLCLENSHTSSGGVPLTESETYELTEVAKQHGAAVHLDGARLFNAAAALNVAPHRLAGAADTVSISLNKGLSAPVGALLCGTEEIISLARVNARRIGAATVHKAGTLAAAGIVALNNREHLIEDNRNAALLARLLSDIDGLHIDLETVRTNLVKVCIVKANLLAREFADRLAQQGVLALERGAYEVRFVLHRFIGEKEVRFIAAAAAEALAKPDFAQ